eukprot:2787627-Pyramimonas_sp.AAC.1
MQRLRCKGDSACCLGIAVEVKTAAVLHFGPGACSTSPLALWTKAARGSAGPWNPSGSGGGSTNTCICLETHCLRSLPMRPMCG